MQTDIDFSKIYFDHRLDYACTYALEDGTIVLLKRIHCTDLELREHMEVQAIRLSRLHGSTISAWSDDGTTIEVVPLY